MKLVAAISILAWTLSFLLHRKSLERFRNPYKPTTPFTETSYNQTENFDAIFTFVQISDLHVSRYLKKGHIEHLSRFISNELSLINPAFVLVTGDLVDGKDLNKLTSRQYKVEWESYQSLLQSARIPQRRGQQFWWDQRGNHDCFNVESFESAQNYFSQYSSTRNANYHFTLDRGFGRYSFVGLDACPRAGTARPFNFFGYIDTNGMDHLEHASIPLEGQQRFNHTFVSTHYPTSCMMFGKTSSGRSFDDVSKGISIFFNGHLHKLVWNLGARMFSHQKTGFLELELGDMKVHGMYRLVVVDNDMITFTDLQLHGSPHYNTYNLTSGTLPTVGSRPTYKELDMAPIVHITNPKPNKYELPMREPLHAIKSSTHIRFLIFSPCEIKSLEISIDGIMHEGSIQYRGRGTPWESFEKDYNAAEYVPLYMSPWDPMVYDDGKSHKIFVSAMDSFGRFSNTSHAFRVDGIQSEVFDDVSGFSQWVISVSFPVIFEDLFLLAYSTCMLFFLLIPKLLTSFRVSNGTYYQWRNDITERLREIDRSALTLPTDEARSSRHTISRVFEDCYFVYYASLLRFCEMALQDWIFYPLFAAGLYMVVGPFFIGEMVPSALEWRNRYAGFFLYGLWFFNGEFVPLTDTWLQGLHELVYCYIPLVIYLSFCCTRPERLYHANNKRHQHPIHKRWYVRALVFCVCLYQASQAYTPGLFYGWTSVLISPMKSWFVGWACIVVLRRARHSDDNVKKDI